MTASTLIYSPLRYGLAVTGSMAYEQSLQKLDAAVINVTARKILGVGTSARLPTLHIGAGVKSMRNLYLQHCAEQLDSTMRATARSFQTKTYSWMQRTYKVSTWRPDTLTLEPSCAPKPRIYRFLFEDKDIKERWLFNVLPVSPTAPRELRVCSVSCSSAKEIEATPNLKELTYNYERASS